MTTVRAGVGHATADDAATAGRRAATAAADEFDGTPTLAYAFGSGAYDQAALLAGIDDGLDCPVVGCSTAGEVADGEPRTESVVVLALGGDGLRAGVGSAPGFDEDPRRAGMRAAGDAVADLAGAETGGVPMSVSAEEEDRWRWYPKTLVNAFGPGLTGSKAWGVVGIHDALGWAHVAGGFAGDDWAFDRTSVYRDGEALDDQMVVSALDVDVKTGIGVAHGLRETEHTFTVTDVEGNRLRGLDGRPPLEVYRDIYGDRVDHEQFLITRPLGRVARGDDPAVVQLTHTHTDEDEGALDVVEAPLAEGDRVAILDTSAEAILSGVEAAVDEALAAAGDPDDVAAILVVDSHCRWYHLSTEEDRSAELEVVRDRVGDDVPIAGFYSYSEIATQNPFWTDDANRPLWRDVHQQSIVVEVLTNEPL